VLWRGGHPVATAPKGTSVTERMGGNDSPDQEGWWRNAAIYQIYVRSFADANGDGTGDLEGVRSRLAYLKALGVDAIWYTPWYLSPLADGGYDVADYRAIDPQFGDLGSAERLIAEANELGIRTIIDVVPNHVSNEHEWFQAALAAEPGSPERARFIFHPGKGENGNEMPTNWVSDFQGTTWTRTTNPDGTPGEWYLHLFTPEQPDLNWRNPEVIQEHLDILKFWFDRGAAGIRIDSAALPVKDPTFPEVPADLSTQPHPYVARPELHNIYRGWRMLADSYDPPRVLVGEVWLPDLDEFAKFLRPDEMHTAFNFDFMSRPWDAAQMRTSITHTLNAHEPIGAPATWVLSNHDITRPVTRYGRRDSSFSFLAKRFNTPTDLRLGTRRARAAAMITAALPGVLYVYQGDELGLPEYEDLPQDTIQDPMYFRSMKLAPGRDGCRVPLPWTVENAGNFGFSPATTEVKSWLPQPAGWSEFAVEAQEQDQDSTLNLYRHIIAERKELPDLAHGELTWLDNSQWPENRVLAFRRGQRFASITNCADQPIALPAGATVRRASDAQPDPTMVAPDTTVWIDLA